MQTGGANRSQNLFNFWNDKPTIHRLDPNLCCEQTKGSGGTRKVLVETGTLSLPVSNNTVFVLGLRPKFRPLLDPVRTRFIVPPGGDTEGRPQGTARRSNPRPGPSPPPKL